MSKPNTKISSIFFGALVGAGILSIINIIQIRKNYFKFYIEFLNAKRQLGEQGKWMEEAYQTFINENPEGPILKNTFQALYARQTVFVQSLLIGGIFGLIAPQPLKQLIPNRFLRPLATAVLISVPSSVITVWFMFGFKYTDTQRKKATLVFSEYLKEKMPKKLLESPSVSASSSQQSQ